MAKASTASFVLTLKLNTSKSDEHQLAHRFYVAFLMKNKLIAHARKSLSSLRQDKEYRSLMSERTECQKEKNPKAKIHAINEQLKKIRLKYGLSEYQFHEWISVQQHRYKKYIDSLTAQKIATAVWVAVEAVLYRKGRSIHFQKLELLNSLEGKTNASGIRYRDDRITWLGLSIQVQLRKGDGYAREALCNRVKYCRIVRKPMGESYHYYAQLILEGLPPKKHRYMTNGDVGIDPGTSSEAIVSDNGCLLKELGNGRPKIQKQVTRLSHKMDRSRRAMNPNNYNPDGTIRNRKDRKPWKNSKSYKITRMRLKTLRRRNVAYVRQSEEILANDILCKHGSDVFAEKMDYKALQKKAKGDKISPKTRKHHRRKRFGKSLAKHAPSRFLTILERKLGYMGKVINYVDTWNYKASQYNHDTDTYEKVSLSTRSKTISDHRVQRDLYSAYLIKNARGPDVVDRGKCIADFDRFIELHDNCIRKLLVSPEHNLTSFGLKDFV